MPTRCLIILLSVWLLSACRGAPQDIHRLVFLPEGSQWSLLSPAEFGGTLSILQKMEASFQGRQAFFLMQLDIDHSSSRIVALTPAMSTLFSVMDNGERISSERSALVPEALEPRQVLADVQLVYWPLAVLQGSLSALDLHMQERVISSQTYHKERLLLNKNHEVLIRIRYSQETGHQRIEFENLPWSYRYQLVTLND